MEELNNYIEIETPDLDYILGEGQSSITVNTGVS
jgi:hypothetical protein